MAELDLEALSRHPVVRKLTDKVRESLGLTFLFVSPRGRVAGIPHGQYMHTSNSLCARVCTDRKKGMKACLSAATSLLAPRTPSSGDFVQKPCHVGLQTLGAPIVIDGQQVGLIATCGFMRAEQVFEEEQSVAHRAARSGWAKGFDEALAQLRQTPTLTSRDVRMVAALMQLLIEQLVHFSRTSEADAEALAHAKQGLELANAPLPFVAKSAAMQAVASVVERSASKRLPTLIEGPTGAGASHLARHLHRAGGHARTPFFVVDARGGLAAGLALVRQGYIGTLCVDHLDAAPLSMQEVLLEAIAQHRDVWWLSTTRAPLAAAVAAGAGVVHLELAPLRARADDLGPLVTVLLQKLGSTLTMAPGVLSALERYDWPGNVGELEAVLRRALALGGLSLAHLPREIGMLSSRARRRAGFHDEVLQFKTGLVAETLQRTEGNVSQAARELGLQRTYLHRLMNELGVQPQRAPK